MGKRSCGFFVISPVVEQAPWVFFLRALLFCLNGAPPLSAEKTLDWWRNPVCAALFYTRPMEFGCVNLIWLSCRLSDTPLWLILPLFFHSPSSAGFTHLLCIFSAPLKPLMPSSQLKCFALDNASPPPTRVGSIRRSCVFPQFAHTRRLGGEQREERCGSTRTVANAYSFHWGALPP